MLSSYNTIHETSNGNSISNENEWVKDQIATMPIFDDLYYTA